MADDRDSRDGAGLRRGLSVPCFAEDPADLVGLGVGAERAGLDGYFLWDHLVHAARWDGFIPINPGRPGDRATVGEIAAVRDRIAGLRGTTAGFDIAVWGELDSAGQVAAHLPRYRAAGATWWVESPGSRPGWLAAVRERLRGPAGGGAEVQSPRG